MRHAGGVYYTPQYIVDYIVKNTLGKIIEGKTPDEVSKIKVLDPACGSGSFLLGAYQFLLDWHLDYYSKHATAKALTPDGSLSSTEKSRILLANIHGVDLDAQAVEVTKLSLLLKAMSGESAATVKGQLSLTHEGMLPSLENNIKCGNSLIGTDFYQVSMVEDEQRIKINAFDWKGKYGFLDIMKSGGFDAVIGNPPYVRMEAFKELKDYLKENYACHDERSDLYAYFVERAHKLVKPGGRFGMIVSNKFLRANYGKPLRDFIAKNIDVEKIVDFAGLPVFVGATVRTIVIITCRQVPGVSGATYTPTPSLEAFGEIVAGSKTIDSVITDTSYSVPVSAFLQPVWAFGSQGVDDLLNRLKNHSIPLATYCENQICMGVKSGLTEAFTIDVETMLKITKTSPKSKTHIKPFLNGRDVRRYSITSQNLYLIYTYHGVDLDGCASITRHLEEYKSKLQGRATKQEWYELQQPQLKFSKFMDGPKIIFPDIATGPRFALDETGYYCANTTYYIPRRDLYLLGILNSRLGGFYFSKTCAGLEGKNETYLRFFGQYLEGFPIHSIDFSDSTDKDIHDKLVSLVERMLELNKRLIDAKGEGEKTGYTREISAIDTEIDKLVYCLYDLTEKEISVVEGSAVT